MRVKKNPLEWTFDIFNLLLMLFVVAITLSPFLHIAAISFNEARDASAGGIGIWPRVWSIDSYITVFRHNAIFDAFLVSVARTIVGTILALTMTSIVAFTMTKRHLIGYKYIYRFFIVSMFVSGGLIPTFFLYQWIGIINTFWVYVLPGMFSVFHMIIMRTFMLGLPIEMEESALLDGASELLVFARIIIPLSKPILATIGLFVAVGQWNAWTDTLFFTTDPRLETLQFVLVRVMNQAEATQIVREVRGAGTMDMRAISITPQSVRMAITMVSVVPILFVYPFLQKYFVKGMLIGAVKG